MPELVFKGKEYVYNHHLTVPYRPLIPNPDKSIGPADLAGNLIIHGDNLHALKSLLPRYAGKVDLIFIDPPYNTGNENWSYNDNVNSPIMREWLKSNPVNSEDMLRHDKWLCMMWPRLTLLRELLSERGSLWITLDDNEVHRARMVFDEVFGDDCFITSVAWQKRTSRENRSAFSPSFDHVIAYSKELAGSWKVFRNPLPVEEGVPSNIDDDPRGPWFSIPFSAQGFRENQQYDIMSRSGNILRPPKGRSWGATEAEYKKALADNRIYFPKGGEGRPRFKMFPWERKGLVPDTLWLASDVGDTEQSKKELLDIFSSEPDLGLHAPKPTGLIERILQIATTKESIVLDSFAGSGSTAHAVLRTNTKDAGNRKFILVESEDYADRITAERIRRVINGYAYVGTQREELLSEKVTWSKLQKSTNLLEQVEAIKQREGFAEREDLARVSPEHRRFDKVNVKMDDGVLLVEGEKKISERVEGLGGEFTYCTLGEPIDAEKILSGKQLPDYASLAAWLFYTATGGTLAKSKIKEKEFFLGKTQDRYVWLIYKPDLAFLKSPDAALTLSFAKKLREKHRDQRHLVFAPAKYLSNKQLLEFGVEFAPLPFALYREA